MALVLVLVLVLEQGNGARGKGAAFEPPCLAHPLRSLNLVPPSRASQRYLKFVFQVC